MPRRKPRPQRKPVRGAAPGQRLSIEAPVEIRAADAGQPESQRRFRMTLYTGEPLSLYGFGRPVVIDLANFRDINSRYGNDVGDKVMRIVAQKLMHSFGRFLFARSGGQEFYALLYGLDNTKAVALVDLIKTRLREPIQLNDYSISVNFNAGVSNAAGFSLDDIMASANQCLLRSKEAGGGLVLGDDIDD